MTKMNIVLASAAVVFGAGCFVLFKEIGDQRTRVRALEAQVVQLQRAMMADTTASQVTFDTAAPISEPPVQTGPLKPVARLPASPSITQPPAKPATSSDNEWRAVLADPAYRRARLAEAKLALQQDYPQLVAELGLSADEAKRFLDLLAEQTLRESDHAMKKLAGENPMQLTRELDVQAEKERREFLGEERFRTWVEYVNSAQARALVQDLRTQLATTSSPLREEQGKPLVKALATEHERHTAEREENYQASNGSSTELPAAERIAYMERRADLIEESLDRQQQAGEMYLDSVQQREFNAMIDSRREGARIELESWRALMEASEKTKSRSR